LITYLHVSRSLAELIRKLDEDGSQEMALALLNDSSLHNQQSSALDGMSFNTMFNTDAFHTSSGGQWDPWSSPNGLCAHNSATSSPSSAIAAAEAAAAAAAAQQRVRRSNSLTQPSGNALTCSGYPSADPWCVHVGGGGNGVGSSGGNGLCAGGQNGRIKPRSLSLSSPGEVANGLPHCPLSPQNSLASSGSGSGSDSIYSDETHRPASFHVAGSGMKGKIPTATNRQID